MKKTIIDFESQFWAGYRKYNCLQLIDEFFKIDNVSTVKNYLFLVMDYSGKNKVLMAEDPSVIFYFYLSLRSFLRASYVLQLKKKKFKLNEAPESGSYLLQGALSDEEYNNPLLVFQNAFKEFTLNEFENFLTTIVYFSMGAYSDDSQENMVTPFIHILKMLDAAQMIRERRIEETKD